MKTDKTKTAYTTKSGTKKTNFSCGNCGTTVRSFGTIYKTEELLDLFCSVRCIDARIERIDARIESRQTK